MYKGLVGCCCRNGWTTALHRCNNPYIHPCLDGSPPMHSDAGADVRVLVNWPPNPAYTAASTWKALANSVMLAWACTRAHGWEAWEGGGVESFLALGSGTEWGWCEELQRLLHRCTRDPYA